MKPWDRQDKETPPSWEAFQTYRDLGAERSLAKAGQLLGKNLTTLEQWSVKHAWVARAAAWDRHVDQAVQARMKAAALERRRRQALLGQSLQAVAGQGLQDLSARLKTNKAKLNGHEVAALAKAGFDIEAVAEGDPNERLGLDGGSGGLEVRIVNVKDLPKPGEAKPEE